MSKDDLLSDLPKVDDLPAENQSWMVYRDWLKSIQTDSNFFERGKGWISYLQGEVLNRCVASKKLKRGDYTKLLKSIGMKKGTAYNCRRIAARFGPREARKKGFSEMLRILKWETLDERGDLTHDAPEFDDVETSDIEETPEPGKGQNFHPNRNRPKAPKPPTVNYDNHGSKLKTLVTLARNLSKFQIDPPVELADAESYYDAIRTEAEKAKRLLVKAIGIATRELKGLGKAA